MQKKYICDCQIVDLQDTALSEKSISNYAQALSGRISEGIRKYLNPDH
jgi:hypothetical protein